MLRGAVDRPTSPPSLACACACTCVCVCVCVLCACVCVCVCVLELCVYERCVICVYLVYMYMRMYGLSRNVYVDIDTTLSPLNILLLCICIHDTAHHVIYV